MLAHTSQPGFSRTFRPGKLTLGLFFPIEEFGGLVPTMEHKAERARQAEAVGFAALWLRDIPLADPTFGDMGQIHDPFVYLGYLAAQTEKSSPWSPAPSPAGQADRKDLARSA